MKSIIAENAKRIIADKGLKQRAVAEKAGYSQQQFSAMMCNRRIVQDTDVMAIANALNVTPNELFGIGEDQEAKGA